MFLFSSYFPLSIWENRILRGWIRTLTGWVTITNLEGGVAAANHRRIVTSTWQFDLSDENAEFCATLSSHFATLPTIADSNSNDPSELTTVHTLLLTRF